MNKSVYYSLIGVNKYSVNLYDKGSGGQRENIDAIIPNIPIKQRVIKYPTYGVIYLSVIYGKKKTITYDKHI